MIPILFEKNETSFSGNGLCRLHDCISCLATEERNSIYECDFEYPITGRNFQEIKIGRIIGVTHEESDDIQPFDIVSFSRPINGIVTFHCTHISYRLSYVTAVLTNVNSLSEAFAQLLWRAQPHSPFYFDTNRDVTGYLSVADGIPHSVRQILGGVEGSILDAYGGEYEWNKFSVFLHTERGTERDIMIRYGLNMLDYNEDYDIQGSYSSCVPYWTNGTETVVGDKVDAISLTITGREECVPLDLSDKFENAPTKLDLNRLAASYMNKNATFKPAQNIHVEFVRLNDLGYEEFDNLLECRICDTITVVFPDYNGSAQYKIVKTVWDVLRDRYESMELGDLSVTLAEALGVSSEKEAKNNILNSIYPVGSVYISTNSVSPSLLFGGTWVQIKGRFLLGTGTPDANTDASFGNMSGTAYDATAKSKGGQDYHQLTVNEMPSHTHTQGTRYSAQLGAYEPSLPWTSNSGTYAEWQTINATGGDQAHNNMPPYFAVYMWERTA